MTSPHDVLDLPADASEEEILAAYRERVIEAHPDQGGSSAEFQRVRDAYQELMFPEDVGARSGGPEPAEGTATVGNRAPDRSRVEYLNYDALEDHGWSLEDEDLFETAAAADLAREDHGEFVVEPGQYLLEAAEAAGLAWPFACRGGACSNCTVALCEGEIPPPVNHVLTDDLIDRGIRLSCITQPVTPEAKVVYNVKHLPGVEELLLPASRFEQAYADD